ncbi:hypothetical protein LTR53_013642 [Teratosphaeriaceae sp. CCFEE 6253]|nr:hypothetical protein LTR53_013642 [Teratosphaeriaceae sp. CCFEE 6253]
MAKWQMPSEILHTTSINLKYMAQDDGQTGNPQVDDHRSSIESTARSRDPHLVANAELRSLFTSEIHNTLLPTGNTWKMAISLTLTAKISALNTSASTDNIESICIGQLSNMTQTQNSTDTATAQLLADKLANVNLAPKSSRQLRMADSAVRHAHHLLYFDYPACILLPESTPFPNPLRPLDAPFMDAPPDDKRIVGVTDTDFHAALPLRTRPHLPCRPPPDAYLELLDAVEKLTSAEGRSALLLVRYQIAESRGLIYRFRLEGIDYDGQRTTLKDVELDERNFGLFLACGEHSPWIVTLQLLVARSSYRAVYHVRERLANIYGAGAVGLEERTWSEPWATPSEQHTGIEQPDVSPDMALSREFAESNATWRHIDTDVARYDLTAEDVHSMTVFRALHVALDSLRAPGLTCPEALSYPEHAITKLVLARFERFLYYDSYFLSLTPAQIWADLLSEAMLCPLDGDSEVTVANVKHLPGYHSFLEQWLTRTMAFIMARQCYINGDDRHAGIHTHDGAPWYNPQEWTKNLEGDDVTVSEEGYDDYGFDERLPKGDTPLATVQDVEMMLRRTTLDGEVQ